MNLNKLIKIINSNTHEYLEKNKDIIVNELIQLGLKSKDQQYLGMESIKTDEEAQLS